ncbi:multiple sugar transport system substrate-binding protein [Gracilibacillus halotolerans]|uniref:Multiple sugar transport system substrate-binding protein n=1 Tax=Gracilibacillus halotolerans TaxID=74386 RepID=A0A841RN94_9BACI|nr:sugar ABC transporter substrate-binding protein [Gracilibacillus halotolerans]MBB6513352.1 multiple sugar transport system substrate-binding protein [Gracilibacillus halotolerans]
MKKWHWSLLALFSILILAACNPGDGSNENDSTEDNESAAEGVAELTFWSYVNPNQHDGQLLMDMVDEFNEANENIEITYEYIPHGEIDQQVSVAVAGGGLPDILMIDNPDHARYASMNVLEDITDKVQEWGEEAQYFEGPWASTIYEGKNYGVPFTTNALALFVNNDMLNEKGIEVPTTWDELTTASQQLTEGNTLGFSMSAISGPEGMFQFLPFLLSTGANYDQLDDPNAYRAMEFVTNMVDEGYMSRETLNWGQGEVASQFTAGNAAMMVNGPWMLPQVRNDAPDMDFSIALIPKDSEYASVLGGENLALPKGDHVEEAWTFLSWLSSKEQAMRFSEGSGQFSPRVDVSDELGWEGDPHLSVFLEAIDNAQPRGPHPAWNEIAEAIQNQVHNSITGISTPEEATEQAHQDVIEIIE